MERDTVRLYSANKCGWLMCNQIEPIGSGIDEGNNMAYIVFPQNTEVQDLLGAYYDKGMIVSRFIRGYNEARRLMREAKNTEMEE